MKRIVRRFVNYRCDVCRTDYDRAKDARKCEQRGVEEKKFHLGSRVRSTEKRACHFGDDYVCEGRIAKILGPVPYDPEVLLKGYGVADSGNHVFMYVIAYTCPVCGQEKHAIYPAACLEAI